MLGRVAVEVAVEVAVQAAVEAAVEAAVKAVRARMGVETVLVHCLDSPPQQRGCRAGWEQGVDERSCSTWDRCDRSRAVLLTHRSAVHAAGRGWGRDAAKLPCSSCCRALCSYSSILRIQGSGTGEGRSSVRYLAIQYCLASVSAASQATGYCAARDLTRIYTRHLQRRRSVTPY